MAEAKLTTEIKREYEDNEIAVSLEKQSNGDVKVVLSKAGYGLDGDSADILTIRKDGRIERLEIDPFDMTVEEEEAEDLDESETDDDDSTGSDTTSWPKVNSKSQMTIKTASE